jgi:lysophospholipase L1-like esterase
MGAAFVAAGWAFLAYAQESSVLAPLPKECEVPGSTTPITAPRLPNIAAAFKERRKIKILAIGGTSASLRGPVSGGHYAVVERFLEAAFKGLEVEIVHRGVSGELAGNAAERIKTEVALIGADLVLWQLGTADAFAQLPVEDFLALVSQTLAWLKERKIDVVLVDPRYARGMAKDARYQAMRAAIGKLANEHNVPRISRYDAEETLERIRRQQETQISEAEATEASYVCMAEYLARAVAAGMFLRASPPKSHPSPKLQ